MRPATFKPFVETQLLLPAAKSLCLLIADRSFSGSKAALYPFLQLGKGLLQEEHHTHKNVSQLSVSTMGKGRSGEDPTVCPCWLKTGRCWLTGLCVRLFCGGNVWPQVCRVCGICLFSLLLFPSKDVVCPFCVPVAWFLSPSCPQLKGWGLLLGLGQ